MRWLWFRVGDDLSILWVKKEIIVIKVVGFEDDSQVRWRRPRIVLRKTLVLVLQLWREPIRHRRLRHVPRSIVRGAID